MRILLAVCAAALALSACSSPEDQSSDAGTPPEPPTTSVAGANTDTQSQTGTWVRRSDWSGVSDLTGQALYDEMCNQRTEYFALMGDPVNREQFAREQVEQMRSDPAWRETFSPADQKRMVDAVLAAGKREC